MSFAFLFSFLGDQDMLRNSRSNMYSDNDGVEEENTSRTNETNNY